MMDKESVNADLKAATECLKHFVLRESENNLLPMSEETPSGVKLTFTRGRSKNDHNRSQFEILTKLDQFDNQIKYTREHICFNPELWKETFESTKEVSDDYLIRMVTMSQFDDVLEKIARPFAIKIMEEFNLPPEYYTTLIIYILQGDIIVPTDIEIEFNKETGKIVTKCAKEVSGEEMAEHYIKAKSILTPNNSKRRRNDGISKRNLDILAMAEKGIKYKEIAEKHNIDEQYARKIAQRMRKKRDT